MARMVKGAKRYILFRGKDEVHQDIVIDVFNRKELQEALKKGRVSDDDHLVKVEVLGKVDPAKL
jgi:hypothetical protein